MGVYYCSLGDKANKMKYKREHTNTKSHTALSMSIINRYSVKNPELFKIDKILKKHVSIYNKKSLNCVTLCVRGNCGL